MIDLTRINLSALYAFGEIEFDEYRERLANVVRPEMVDLVHGGSGGRDLDDVDIGLSDAGVSDAKD